MKVTVFEKTEPTLKEAQDLVGGYVERIGSNLKVNPEASNLVGMPIVGNVVVVKNSKNW